MVVLLCMVLLVKKSLVREIAHNKKTKRDGTANPTQFNSIFDGDYGPNINSRISEGFHVETMSSSTTLLFSE